MGWTMHRLWRPVISVSLWGGKHFKIGQIHRLIQWKQSGSDVAKEAGAYSPYLNYLPILEYKSASIILLNNDFSSIPRAIELGRLVFDNLKKVILYLMPVCNPLFCYVDDPTTWIVYRLEPIPSSFLSLQMCSWACSSRSAPTSKSAFPSQTTL